jgi:hypothetical protein
MILILNVTQSPLIVCGHFTFRNLDALILASNNNYCQGVLQEIPIFPMSADVNLMFTSVFLLQLILIKF